MPVAQYIGRELVYDDSLHVSVTGIVDDYKSNTDFPYTNFLSFSTIDHSFLKQVYRRDEWRFNPRIPGIQAFVKLPANVDIQKAGELFASFTQTHIAADSFLRLLRFTLVLQPLEDIHFNEGYSHDGIRKANLPALYGLIAVAIFILLLAIVNFINLSTAQSLQQARDISIRRILGATRLGLICRSLKETALLTMLAAIIALAAVRPILSLFSEYVPEGLAFNPFSLANLGFTIGCVVLTTLVAGIYPALALVRPGSGQGVSSQTVKASKPTLRRVLIVFQFSISLVFIIAAVTVSRQLNYMIDANMGFNSDAVVSVTNFGAPPQQLRLFAQEALHIPGVEEATMQGHSPAGMALMEFPMSLDGRADKTLMVDLQGGEQRFLPFYRMRLLAGHNLSSGDSLREFVINDTYRKALGFSKPADAIGHLITWQNKSHPIVGVAADFHTSSLHTPILALAIARVANLDNSVGLRIALKNKETLLRLEKLWKQLLPDYSFGYSFLDENILRLYKEDKQLSWLIRVSTTVAIFISCMGLLGLILFIVERRKKEISIRKVLGAGIAQIFILLNKEFVALVAIALAIASPIAFWGMHRWLQNFAYRTSISWWTFFLAGLIAIAISTLTISWRVIRAALVNPSDSLRDS